MCPPMINLPNPRSTWIIFNIVNLSECALRRSDKSLSTLSVLFSGKNKTMQVISENNIHDNESLGCDVHLAFKERKKKHSVAQRVSVTMIYKVHNKGHVFRYNVTSSIMWHVKKKNEKVSLPNVYMPTKKQEETAALLWNSGSPPISDCG